MKAYKHWKRQYADDLEQRGRIRLMPLSYYWQEFDRPGVQDKNENAILATHRAPLWIQDTSSPGARETLNRLLFDLEDSSEISVSECQVRYSGPEIYVFCVTTIETAGLFEKDDAVTTIPDIEAFSQALAEASVGRFVDGWVANVQYNWAPQYAEDGPLTPPSPFRKHPDFASQKEIRIALLPRSKMEGPCYIESDLLVRALAS